MYRRIIRRGRIKRDLIRRKSNYTYASWVEVRIWGREEKIWGVEMQN
jgi:hypothetical protein